MPVQPTCETEIDTLAITDEQWINIVSGLDSQAESRPDHSRRRYDRHALHQVAYLHMVRINNPDTDAEAYLLRLRNISTGGIGFLHGEKICTGAPCTVGIRTTQGHMVLVIGHVARCRILKSAGKGIFEIGIEFKKQIDIDSFSIDHTDPDQTAR